jgi:DNA processing protein
VNIAYPLENAPLFEQIAARGAVISEFPIDSPPVPENFPRRNRIVSGMSRGVFVIEADERSGALITARQACDDHGRPVFALPGRVDNRMSAGPHMLIRDGATLVTKLEDILDGLGPLPHQAIESLPESVTAYVVARPAEAAAPDVDLELLSAGQRTIIAHLDGEPVSVDQIIERSGLDASAVMRELTFLCLKGLVRRAGGQMFVRARR